MMKNKFYVIATPIGNMNETNKRIFDALAKCEYLFCEDTRVTQKFLSLIGFDAKTLKLISYHKFNEMAKLDHLLELVDNHCCGLISDAGYPAISDPGQILINNIRNQLPDIHIEVINCASAIICALVGSGFDSSNFYFHGFLDKKTSVALKQLEYLSNIKTTLILYESVHRIYETLDLIRQVFGDTKICVARELTKQNETYYFGTPNAIKEQLTLKGEFVILIANQPIQDNSQKCQITNAIIKDVMELSDIGLKIKNACKFVASKNNLNSSELYAYIQKNKAID